MMNLLAGMSRSPLGLLGAILATVSGVLILTLFGLSLVGFEGGPYLGILAYLVLPAFFVLGLLLVPLGAWLGRRRGEAGATQGLLPVLDLNQPRVRRIALAVAALSVINVVIVAIATYEGVTLMETPGFCGSCHSVMDPELAAYRRSPHARVACVECHIGPGAPWFVKSKLSGAWQVVSVTLDLYPRPIPVPVHDLRPARDTCERCHWPDRSVGDRLQVRTSFASDQANTEQKTVLLMHVGGGARGARGIHWHVGPGVEVRYLADPSRQRIGAVELVLPDGTRRTYRSGDPESDPGPQAQWRTMDCIDCHNRPTHRFGTPEGEIDAALASGRLDRSLPFVRREGLRLLTARHPSHEAARAAIRDGLRAFYAEQTAAAPSPATVEAAAAVLGDIYAGSVWPSMNIGWGTYPSLLGHEETPGCFRCHDEAHVADGGRTISQDCGLCHSVLAQDEPDPEILKELYR